MRSTRWTHWLHASETGAMKQQMSGYNMMHHASYDDDDSDNDNEYHNNYRL